MTKEDIAHLASLARIRISEAEKESFLGEFDAILGYVAQINDAIELHDTKPTVPLHANVLREDVVTTAPEEYTESLLSAAPKRYGRYVEVKKILGGTDE